MKSEKQFCPPAFLSFASTLGATVGYNRWLMVAGVTLTTLVVGCSDSGSGSGGSGGGGSIAPVLVSGSGDAAIYSLDEQLSYEILPTVGIDSVNVVRWRWSAEPVRAGALAECGGRANFDLTQAVDSLQQACSIDSKCSFSFDQAAGTDRSGQVGTRFVVDVPILKAPVGLAYELEAVTNLDETIVSTTTFCLIPENEPPVATDDAFTVVQGELLVVGAGNLLNLLSNDVDDVDSSNLPELRVSTTPLAAPQLASQFTLTADGGFTYLFDGDLAGFAGNRATDAFTYQLSDGVNTATAEVRLTIVSRDNPPVQTAAIPPHTAVAGIATEFDFSDNFEDPENSQLLFSVVPGTLPPNSDLEVSVLGALSGVAATEDVGNYTVSIEASDTVNTSLSANFLLTVVDNQQPVVNTPGDLTVEFGQLLVIDLTPNFSDPEGEPLTYSLTTEPASGVTINPDTGLITGTLVEPGTYVFTVTASDGVSPARTTQFEVTQGEQPNRAPVLRDPIANQGVTVGDSISPISGGFTDLDGDELTYSISSVPPGLSFNANTGVLSGVATSVGISNLTIQATDTEGASATSNTFALTITAQPNDPPVLTVDIPNQSATAGQSIEPFSGSFTDSQGQTLTYSADGLPNALSINPNTGVVTGIPATEGQFTVTITAEDSVGDSTVSNSFRIIVIPAPNQVPVFGGTISSQSIILGTAIAAITGDFSDPDADALVFSATGLPAGVSVNTSNGTISGTPTAVGTSTVVITATDSSGDSASSNEFTLSVSPVPNNGPAFNGPIGAQTAITGSAISPLSMAGFFSDIDGDTLSYALASGSSLPAGLSLDASGTLSGTPTSVGSTNVAITASDSDGASVTSNTFTFTVTAANIAPQVTGRTPAGDLSILVNGIESLEIAVTDESVPTVTYSANSTDTGVVVVTPGNNSNEFDIEAVSVGSAQITVTVIDDAGLSDTETINVTVNALPNVAPQIDSRAPAGTSVTIVAGNSEAISIVVSDEEISTLAYSASSSDTGVATVGVNAAGNFTVNAVATGSAVVTLQVQDNIGQTDTDSFTVNVPAVNQPPTITGRNPAGDPLTGITIGDVDPVTFTVTDENTATLVFSASSSDTSVVAIDSIDQNGTVFLGGLAQGSSTITVTVTDDQGLDTIASFNVDVPGPANVAPQVTGSLNNSSFQEALLIAPIDVSAIFVDPDGDALTYSVNQLPAGLSLNASSGAITGTPATVGSTSVLVSATDAAGTNTLVFATPFDIVITAAPVVNQPPVAGPALPNQVFVEGTVFGTGPSDVNLSVASLISDPDTGSGDVLTYAVDQLPAGLTIDPLTADIVGTATTVETVTVTVSATDQAGLTAIPGAPPFTFEITAAPVVNQPPVAGPALPNQVFVEGTVFGTGPSDVNLSVASLISDPDTGSGDVLTYAVDQLPAGLTIDPATADIVGTANTVETVTVTVSATDQAGLTAVPGAPPFTFEITAAPVVNQPPVAGAALPAQTFVEGTVFGTGPSEVNLNVGTLITDPDIGSGDVLTYAVDQLPTGLTIDPLTADIVGTATTVETVTVTVSATDQAGLTAVPGAPPFTFEITAAPVI